MSNKKSNFKLYQAILPSLIMQFCIIVNYQGRRNTSKISLISPLHQPDATEGIFMLLHNLGTNMFELFLPYMLLTIFKTSIFFICDYQVSVANTHLVEFMPFALFSCWCHNCVGFRKECMVQCLI